jgi:hypothetical protein
MPVQAPAGLVVPDRGPRVSVGGSLLNIAQRHAGVQGGGDGCVSERVRSDGLGDPGTARDLPDDPPGAVPVQPPPVSGEEDRAVAAFAGRQDRDRAGARESVRARTEPSPPAIKQSPVRK